MQYNIVCLKTNFVKNTIMWSLVKFFIAVIFSENWLLHKVVGQECQFEYENGTELVIDQFGVKLSKIQDVAPPGQVLLSLNAKYVTNITYVDPHTNSQEHYITPTLEKDKLVLELTDHFLDYEENEVLPSISISITFKCITGTLKVEFVQPIEDTNNHAPEFLQESYIYTLPMPFPKMLSLTCFASISARDIDLSNNTITFHLNQADSIANNFAVSSVPDSDDRTVYNAILATASVINFQEDAVFRLYATDSGSPPLTSYVNVTIHVDRDSSIIEFANALYTANVTTLKPEEADGYNIKFLEGDISLKGGVDNTVIYNIRKDLTDYSKNFELTISDDHTKVQLTLKDPPKQLFLESSVLLELTATKSGLKQSTILHITLPGSKSHSTGHGRGISDIMWSIIPMIVFSIILTAATS